LRIRARGGTVLNMYLQAVRLLVRNPALVLAPLFTGVLGVLVQEFGGPTPGDALGGLTGGILQLLIFLFNSFGLAISVIIADRAWRRGRASFDEGWEEGRRKAGDIFLAALGLNFIVYIALQIGAFVNWQLGMALYLLAFFFLMYTIPAAAIGGVPGFMALNTSIERVRENYPVAILLAVVFVVLYWGVGTELVGLSTAGYGVVSFLIGAVVRAIVLAYFSLVLARAYTDAAFVRRRF
jgi:hypothetical protein